MQAYDIAQEVFDRLSEKLDNHEFFFEGEDAETKQISSLDLVAYVYLKELLNNISESKIVQLLNKHYKNLSQFVERMDKKLATEEEFQSMRQTKIEITKTEGKRRKIVHDFMQPADYEAKDSQHNQYEDVSEEGQKKLFMRRGCVTFMA
mmetsp:Transcript_32575/g.37161  ORF Transcript_32575/g.37161 Transcript_32575/m.37161 type:complete len:149 (-) Transcript_32575:70-516(-)